MAAVMVKENKAGRPFAAVIVHTGDFYGRDFVLTNEDETLVEFWDLMHPFAPVADDPDCVFGQFVARYRADSLLDRTRSLADSGLCLDGGNADVWSIDGETMAEFLDWIKSQTTDGVAA